MADKATPELTTDILDDVALLDATRDAANALIGRCAQAWRQADDTDRTNWLHTIRDLRAAAFALDPTDRPALIRYLTFWTTQAADLTGHSDE